MRPLKEFLRRDFIPDAGKVLTSSSSVLISAPERGIYASLAANCRSVTALDMCQDALIFCKHAAARKTVERKRFSECGDLSAGGNTTSPSLRCVPPSAISRKSSTWNRLQANTAVYSPSPAVHTLCTAVDLEKG